MKTDCSISILARAAFTASVLFAPWVASFAGCSSDKSDPSDAGDAVTDTDTDTDSDSDTDTDTDTDADAGTDTDADTDTDSDTECETDGSGDNDCCGLTGGECAPEQLCVVDFCDDIHDTDDPPVGDCAPADEAEALCETEECLCFDCGSHWPDC